MGTSRSTNLENGSSPRKCSEIVTQKITHPRLSEVLKNTHTNEKCVHFDTVIPWKKFFLKQ